MMYIVIIIDLIGFDFQYYLMSLGHFFISNIVKICSAIIVGRESLPRCWSVLLELMSVHEKAEMSSEKVTQPNEIQSEPHPGSAGH